MGPVRESERAGERTAVPAERNLLLLGFFSAVSKTQGVCDWLLANP